ncbi:MAG: Crp/Fnr family transcriptional regulator [Spirochaetales bacterium]|nr:Crp/Fnr family transcriptional regulator [Spirochaetales bacterium]
MDSLGSGLPVALSGLGRRRQLGAGMILFLQDDPAAYCFFVEAGELSLRLLSPSGHEVELTKIEAGDWCAEALLFAESTYPAQAVVTKDCRLVQIHRDEILKNTNSEVTAFFLRLLAYKCLRLNKRIEQLTILGARERIVQYILGLCPAHNDGCPGKLSHCRFPFPKKKLEIAQELGMTPETLSRIFRQLEGENLIEIEGATLGVVSCARLRQSQQ